MYCGMYVCVFVLCAVVALMLLNSYLQACIRNGRLSQISPKMYDARYFQFIGGDGQCLCGVVREEAFRKLAELNKTQFLSNEERRMWMAAARVELAKAESCTWPLVGSIAEKLVLQAIFDSPTRLLDKGADAGEVKLKVFEKGKEGTISI